MSVPYPFALFTGDAEDFKKAKTAFGVYEWAPHKIACQYSPHSFEGVKLDLKQVSTISDAIAAGAVTLLVGYSPFERDLPESFRHIVKSALRNGLNVASGLHDKLNDDPELSALAQANGVKIYDFRHRDEVYPKGTGLFRSGKRLLTVGTDCAVGKKFTAISITRALQAKGCKATFRSTGQTGYLISDGGINNDTIQADFLSGAAEWLSPANDADHIDVIEGQGALTHPSFGGGAYSLIQGSQPDYLVMCHDVRRETMRGVTKLIPSLIKEIEHNLYVARLTNSNVKLVGVSLFGKGVSAEDMEIDCLRLSYMLGVPVFDPNRPNDDFFRLIHGLQWELDKCANQTSEALS